jgi:hypothetical protein
MLLVFAWLERAITFGLLLVAFGSERLNEIVADLRNLRNDAQVAIKRRES